MPPGGSRIRRPIFGHEPFGQVIRRAGDAINAAGAQALAARSMSARTSVQKGRLRSTALIPGFGAYTSAA